jgi:hypothetical protein
LTAIVPQDAHLLYDQFVMLLSICHHVFGHVLG